MKAALCALVSNFEISVHTADDSMVLNGGVVYEVGTKTMLEVKKLK